MTKSELMNFLGNSENPALSLQHMSDNHIMVTTSCVYPSFDQVQIFLEESDGGHRVHDKGGAYNDCWKQGVEHTQIKNSLEKALNNHDFDPKYLPVLSLSVTSPSWIHSAILAVANTAALVAAQIQTNYFEKMSKNIDSSTSAEKIVKQLWDIKKRRPAVQWQSNKEVLGYSGKQHKFDFVVSDMNKADKTVIGTVSPNHNSIAHKFTAFSDIMKNGQKRERNLAIFETELSGSDSSIISEVADLVPIQDIGNRLSEISG